MKLSIKINYILLPIIALIFSAAGIYAYHIQKSLLLSSLSAKLEYESHLIIDDVAKNMLELDSLTELFLNSAEVLRFLEDSKSNLSAYAMEAQLLRQIKSIKITYGKINSFSLIDSIGGTRFFFDVNDPFAIPKTSTTLQKHLSYLRQQINPTGSSQISPSSYELRQDEDNSYKFSIYRTFSPEQSLHDNTFSIESTLHTASIEVSLDPISRYLEPLKVMFDHNISMQIIPQKILHSFDDNVSHNITFNADNSISVHSHHQLLDLSILLPSSYIDSLLKPYLEATVILVLNITFITFFLLKYLIHRLIIRPVVSLTHKVEQAIQGDETVLEKVNNSNEVASLNNNYIELLDELNKLAKFDNLTGLANRYQFNLLIRNVIKTTITHNTKCALLYIDLDNFKKVNDVYGHHVGDLLLVTFSERLADSFSADDVLINGEIRSQISRLAGDEFAVLLSGFPNTDTVAHAAQHVVDLCQHGFVVNNIKHDIKLSVGIAVAPEDATTPELLLMRADAAMYQVKKTGKNGFRFYSKKLDDELKRHSRIESEIRTALHENSFYLMFMPIYDCKTGYIVGAEALLRANSTELIKCGPAEFIPIAESSTLIREIDIWVLDSAIQKLKLLIDEYDFTGTMSVNFSASELKNPEFVNSVSKLIDHYSIPANQLEMEITETCLVTSHSDANEIAMLTRLKKLGVHLSLDDFGTGYTAFNQLVNYPVDSLKIDRSFVNAIGQKDSDDKLLVDIIAELASIYKLTVVAEGVETVEQLRYINSLGCHRAQGYLMSKPLNWHDFLLLFSNQTPLALLNRQQDEHRLQFNSLSGSVTIQVTNQLIIIDYKGVVTDELIDYVFNSMPFCFKQLKNQKWGYIGISDATYMTSDTTFSKLRKLAQWCMENGCIEGAYVIRTQKAIEQTDSIRRAIGLPGDINDKLFSSKQAAELYLTNILTHSQVRDEIG